MGDPLRRAGRPGDPDRPFESVHVLWLAGMSCDGCSIALQPMRGGRRLDSQGAGLGALPATAADGVPQGAAV